MSATSDRLTTVISTKGQVILPKAIRDQRRWPAGTRLTIENTADGVLLRPAPVFAPARIDALFGSLAYGGAPKSIEDMDAAVAAEAAKRARD